MIISVPIFHITNIDPKKCDNYIFEEGYKITCFQPESISACGRHGLPAAGRANAQ
jgi:hypothetical protein